MFSWSCMYVTRLLAKWVRNWNLIWILYWMIIICFTKRYMHSLQSLPCVNKWLMNLKLHHEFFNHVNKLLILWDGKISFTTKISFWQLEYFWRFNIFLHTLLIFDYFVKKFNNIKNNIINVEIAKVVGNIWPHFPINFPQIFIS